MEKPACGPQETPHSKPGRRGSQTRRQAGRKDPEAASALHTDADAERREPMQVQMSSATSTRGVLGKVPGPSAVSGRNSEGREGEGFCTEEALISNLFVCVQLHVAQTASGCALNERAVVWKPQCAGQRALLPQTTRRRYSAESPGPAAGHRFKLLDTGCCCRHWGSPRDASMRRGTSLHDCLEASPVTWLWCYTNTYLWIN